MSRAGASCRRSIPEADWQRCAEHFYRNVFSHVPNGKVAEIAHMLKAIHAQEDRAAAESKAREIVARLKALKLKSAAELVEQKVAETLTYYAYPSTHWRRSAPTIHWSGSFAKSGDERAWSVRAWTADQH